MQFIDDCIGHAEKPRSLKSTRINMQTQQNRKLVKVDKNQLYSYILAMTNKKVQLPQQ